jgi:hypothetical protein
MAPNDRLEELFDQFRAELDRVRPQSANGPRTTTAGLGSPISFTEPEADRGSVKKMAEFWTARMRRYPSVKIAPHSYRIPTSVDAAVARLCEKHSLAKGDLVAYLLSYAVERFEPGMLEELEIPDPVPAPLEVEQYSLDGALRRVVPLRPPGADAKDQTMLTVGRRAVRDTPCLVLREDGRLSGRHFSFVASPEGALARDHDSTNGTWISLTPEDDVTMTAGESFLFVSPRRSVQLTLEKFDAESGSGSILVVENESTEPRRVPFQLDEGFHMGLRDLMPSKSKSPDSVTGSAEMANEGESLMARMESKLSLLPAARDIDTTMAGPGELIFRRVDPKLDGELVPAGRYVLAGNNMFRLVATLAG